MIKNQKNLTHDRDIGEMTGNGDRESYRRNEDMERYDKELEIHTTLQIERGLVGEV